MNTIVCLSVCLLVIGLFFATPYILLRREMGKWSPAPTDRERFWFEVALVVIFILVLAIVAPLVANLSEGYAALYVDQVGWPTL